MINGTYSIPRVVEESYCRTTKKYRMTEIGVYRIHSTSLMTNIPFEEDLIDIANIDDSIFINDEETQIKVTPGIINVQNFLTTRYIGRAPLEFYGSNDYTEMGRQFLLVCKNGNPNSEYRVFGTEDAIRGYNRNANDNTILPEGGE